MNIVDIIILAIIVLFGFYGYKTGFIKTVVVTIGLILVFVFSYLFKGPVAEFLSMNFPFFSFAGSFKGIAIINIIIYQLIAFIIVFSILLTVFALVVKISSLVEKLLKVTVLLRLPSKILGLILGVVEGIIISSISLMILTLPIINITPVHESKIKDFLMETVPITGTLSRGTNKAINEIMELKKVYTNSKDKDEFNSKCFDVLLKYNIIDVEYGSKLINSGKIKIENADEILLKYK